MGLLNEKIDVAVADTSKDGTKSFPHNFALRHQRSLWLFDQTLAEATVPLAPNRSVAELWVNNALEDLREEPTLLRTCDIMAQSIYYSMITKNDPAPFVVSSIQAVNIYGSRDKKQVLKPFNDTMYDLCKPYEKQGFLWESPRFKDNYMNGLSPAP